MKSFLKKIQNIQDGCVERIKGQKDNSLLADIAGTKIRSIDGGISFTEWKHLADNIHGNSKDWRRFKEDPNKVVIEKNFFLNAIKLTNDYFIFRPKNDAGATGINVNDEFYSSMPKNKKIGWKLFLFIPLLTLMLATYFSVYYFSNFSVLPIMIWCIVIPLMIRYNKHLKKVSADKKAEWENEYSKKPYLLLDNAPCSFKKDFDKWRKMACVKIDLSYCPFRCEYEKILNELASSAHQMKGDIVWLWRYRTLPLNPDLFNFSYENLHDSNNFINIRLDIKSGNIIPAIETENSFIFFLDYFSDEMEKNHYNYDFVFDVIKSKTQNPHGNVKRDDLFKENWID